MNDYKKYKEELYEEAKNVTANTIADFILKLMNRPHDYDTCCYDTAAVAVAAASLLAGSIGITGFQAGAVMWEFMEQFNHVEFPARLLEMKDLMYPQYERKFTSIKEEVWEWLQKECEESLADKDKGFVHPEVRKHWESIAVDKKVPFGLKIEKRKQSNPGGPEAIVVQR